MSSAFRGLIYNHSIGSNDASQHPKGKALDLHHKDVVNLLIYHKANQTEFWSELVSLGLRGVGYYDWGVHIDCRSGSHIASWDYRKKKDDSTLIDTQLGNTIGVEEASEVNQGSSFDIIYYFMGFIILWFTVLKKK